MRFEWDKAKNARNIWIHGIDFADAWSILDAPILEWPDERRDYAEERWCGLGMLNGRIVAFVYTMRAENLWRWISVRKANASEIRRYTGTVEL